MRTWGEDALAARSRDGEKQFFFFLFLVRMQCTVTWAQLFGVVAHVTTTSESSFSSQVTGDFDVLTNGRQFVHPEALPR